jgi:hypothetical protein
VKPGVCGKINASTLKGLNVNRDFVFNQIGKCYKSWTPQDFLVQDKSWTPKDLDVQDKSWTPDGLDVQDKSWTPKDLDVQDKSWTPEDLDVQDKSWTPDGLDANFTKQFEMLLFESRTFCTARQ